MHTRTLKPIPGFAGYLAGDDGTIWTIKRKGGNARQAGALGAPRELSYSRNSHGYLRVNLDCGGRNRVMSVHRLVLLAFVGPPKTGYQACHFPDHNPENNRLSNLRWDTQIENARDKTRALVRGSTKVCKRCGREKLRREFYADKRASDGLQGCCKPCHVAVARATRDPEKKRIANRLWMRGYRKPAK